MEGGGRLRCGGGRGGGGIGARGTSRRRKEVQLTVSTEGLFGRWCLGRDRSSGSNSMSYLAEV